MDVKTFEKFFVFQKDPFELTETKNNLKKIKANPKNESKVDSFLIKFLPLIFNKEHSYECTPQFYDSEKNRSDLQIHYKNDIGEKITILIVENKSEKGEGYYDMLSQAPKYSDNDLLNTNAYLMTMKGTVVSFYTYVQDFHSSNKFCLKGGGVDGLLGLYFDWRDMCIKIVPQVNTFIPQAIYYDFSKANTCIKTKYSILAILNFISTQSISLDLMYDSVFNFYFFFDQVEEGTLNKNEKSRLLIKSLVKKLKWIPNPHHCNPKNPRKVLGTSKISNKTWYKHTIDFTGKVNFSEIAFF